MDRRIPADQPSCTYCAKTVNRVLPRGQRRQRQRMTFCDRECYVRWRYGWSHERFVAHESERRARVGREQVCRLCGGTFTPTTFKKNMRRTCERCTTDALSLARRKRYGLTLDDQRQILDRYDGKCWICRDYPVEHIDHSHETGQVRGGLCNACNRALHYVERDGWVSLAQEYLQAPVPVFLTGKTKRRS